MRLFRIYGFYNVYIVSADNYYHACAMVYVGHPTERYLSGHEMFDQSVIYGVLTES